MKIMITRSRSLSERKHFTFQIMVYTKIYTMVYEDNDDSLPWLIRTPTFYMLENGVYQNKYHVI